MADVISSFAVAFLDNWVYFMCYFISTVICQFLALYPPASGCFGVYWLCLYIRASQVTLLVMDSPAVLEMQIQSLGCKDSLKEEMSVHSSFLP